MASLKSQKRTNLEPGLITLDAATGIVLGPGRHPLHPHDEESLGGFSANSGSVPPPAKLEPES